MNQLITQYLPKLHIIVLTSIIEMVAVLIKILILVIDG